jgi:hypothetical protein
MAGAAVGVRQGGKVVGKARVKVERRSAKQSSSKRGQLSARTRSLRRKGGRQEVGAVLGKAGRRSAGTVRRGDSRQEQRRPSRRRLSRRGYVGKKAFVEAGRQSATTWTVGKEGIVKAVQGSVLPGRLLADSHLW